MNRTLRSPGRRTLAAMLAIVLCWTLLILPGLMPQALAAKASEAKTLRVEAIEGTVTVSNKTGKAITYVDRMKLFNGYSLKTEKSSYAYISLDDSRAVKVDQKTEITVSERGKNLEIAAKTGTVFLDIAIPLRADESLNVRTSTMVTGIRGTIVYVQVIDEFTSRISLLEGEVFVVITDPVTGEMRSELLRAGQTMTSTVTEEELPDGTYVDVDITGIDEGEVPAAVKEAIRDSKETQERLKEGSPLDVEKLIEDTDEALAREQQAAEAADKKAEDEQKTMDSNTEDAFVEEKVPEPAPLPGGPVTLTLGTGNVPRAEVEDAFTKADIVILPAGATVELGSDNLRIPSGRTLVNRGTIKLDSNAMINQSMTTYIHEAGAVLENGDFLNGDAETSNGRMVINGGTFGNVTIVNHALGAQASELIIRGTVALTAGSLNIENHGILSLENAVLPSGTPIESSKHNAENPQPKINISGTTSLSAGIRFSDTDIDITGTLNLLLNANIKESGSIDIGQGVITIRNAAITGGGTSTISALVGGDANADYSISFSGNNTIDSVNILMPRVRGDRITIAGGQTTLKGAAIGVDENTAGSYNNNLYAEDAILRVAAGARLDLQKALVRQIGIAVAGEISGDLTPDNTPTIWWEGFSGSGKISALIKDATQILDVSDAAPGQFTGLYLDSDIRSEIKWIDSLSQAAAEAAFPGEGYSSYTIMAGQMVGAERYVAIAAENDPNEASAYQMIAANAEGLGLKLLLANETQALAFVAAQSTMSRAFLSLHIAAEVETFTLAGIPDIEDLRIHTAGTTTVTVDDLDEALDYLELTGAGSYTVAMIWLDPSANNDPAYLHIKGSGNTITVDQMSPQTRSLFIENITVNTPYGGQGNLGGTTLYYSNAVLNYDHISDPDLKCPMGTGTINTSGTVTAGGQTITVTPGAPPVVDTP